MSVPKPEEYDVHHVCGFVPENPLTELPPYFSPWTDIAFRLQEHVRDGSLRKRVHEMPLLDHVGLGDDVRAWRLAHLVLTEMAQCYVWGQGPDNVTQKLPRQIAIPLKGVSGHLGIPPFMTYHTSMLCNWKLINDSKQLTLQNMETILTMNGGKEESWFFCATVAVELAAADGVMAVLEAQRNIFSNNADKVALSLLKIETSLRNMILGLQRFKDGCSPEAFLTDIAPFFGSWDGLPFQKKNLGGLILEGVSEEPVAYACLSGAQSSSLPVFDVVLGINPYPPKDKTMATFHELMPPQHRRFVEAVAAGPSIKDFVLHANHSKCSERLERCVQAVADFRSQHINNITSFRIIPSVRNAKASGNPDDLQQVSDENKALLAFLKRIRDAHLSRDGEVEANPDNIVTWIQRTVFHVVTSPWTKRFLVGTLAAILVTFYRRKL